MKKIFDSIYHEFISYRFSNDQIPLLNVFYFIQSIKKNPSLNLLKFKTKIKIGKCVNGKSLAESFKF